MSITEFEPPQGLATDSMASVSWSHSPSPVRKRYSCRPEGSSTSTSQKPDSDSESGIGCVSQRVNDPTKATDFAFGRLILKRTFFECCFVEPFASWVVEVVGRMDFVFIASIVLEKGGDIAGDFYEFRAVKSDATLPYEVPCPWNLTAITRAKIE
jgi:hypothetical protein